MNNNCLETTEEQAKVLELVEQKERCKLILTKEVLNMIEYTCKTFPSKEWSGVLFYEVEGTLLDIKNLSIKPVSIYPLDLGSSTSTELTYNEEYIAYIMRNPQMLDYRTGILHSHNSMQSFFSGTDIEALAKKAGSFPGFLSLIVNNSGNYVAKLAVKVTEKRNGVVELKDYDFANKEYVFEDSCEYAKVYDCNIECQGYKVSEELQSITQKLQSDENLQSYKRNSTCDAVYNQNTGKSLWDKPYWDGNDKNLWDRTKEWTSKAEVKWKKPTKEEIEDSGWELAYIDFCMRAITLNPIYSCDSYDGFAEAFSGVQKYLVGVTKIDDAYIDKVSKVLCINLDHINMDSEDAYDMVEYLYMEISEIYENKYIEITYSDFWIKMMSVLLDTLVYYMDEFTQKVKK